LLGEAAAEDATKYCITMKDAEAFAIQPGSNEETFFCQYCEIELPKAKAVNHYCKCHFEEPDDVMTWLVFKDIKRIKKHRAPLMGYSYNAFFEATLLHGSAEEEEEWLEAVAEGFGEGEGEEEEDADTEQEEEEEEEKVGDECQEESQLDWPELASMDVDDEEKLDEEQHEEEEGEEEDDKMSWSEPDMSLEGASAFEYGEEALLPLPELEHNEDVCASSPKESEDPNTKLLQELVQMAKGKDISVKLQTLTIKGSVAIWVPDAKAKDRHHYPKVLKPADINAFDMEAFCKFMGEQEQLDEESQDIYKRAICRLAFWLQADGDQSVDLEGIIVNMQRCGTLKQLKAHAILDDKRTWTRSLYVALCHYANHQLLALHEDEKALKLIRRFVQTELSPWKKTLSVAKSIASQAKNVKDSYKLGSMAAPGVVKEAVKGAMVDLWVIHKHFKGKKTMPVRPRQVANSLMVGITYCNQMGGRNQQWETLTAAEANAELATGKGFVETDKYKTAKVYGALGMDVSPGSQAAMELYMDLPDKRTDLFLDPAMVKSKRVSVSSALHSFHHSRLHGYTPMTSTLFRKNLHTMVKDKKNQDRCMDFLCKVDKHRTSTGEKHYVVSNPKQDAETSKLIFQSFMGDPVPWPSLAELKKMKRPYEDVIAKFSVGGEESGEGSDAPTSPAAAASASTGAASAPTIAASASTDAPCAPADADSVPDDDDTIAGYIGKSMQPEAPVSSRRIIYNKAIGLFQKVEDKPPNLTAAARQRHFLTEAQKDFIKSKAPTDSEGFTLCPNKIVILAIIEEGEKQGIITDKTTYEGVRSYLTRLKKSGEEEQAKIEKAKKKKNKNKDVD
jgi:hypothetical protein